MAHNDTNIRDTEITETLRQAHCLAMLISTTDQAEESVRDAAMLQLELIEKAIAQLAGHAVPA